MENKIIMMPYNGSIFDIRDNYAEIFQGYDDNLKEKIK